VIDPSPVVRQRTDKPAPLSFSSPSAPHARHACEKLASDILRQDFPHGLEEELLATFSKVREIYDRVVK